MNVTSFIREFFGLTNLPIGKPVLLVIVRQPSHAQALGAGGIRTDPVSLDLVALGPGAADMHSDNNQMFDDRSMRVWDVATGRQIHKFNAGRPHSGAAISPDGR